MNTRTHTLTHSLAPELQIKQRTFSTRTDWVEATCRCGWTSMHWISAAGAWSEWDQHMLDVLVVEGDPLTTDVELTQAS